MRNTKEFVHTPRVRESYLKDTEYMFQKALDKFIEVSQKSVNNELNLPYFVTRALRITLFLSQSIKHFYK